MRSASRGAELDLTVLVCTHNYARLLDEALESVARQELPAVHP